MVAVGIIFGLIIAMALGVVTAQRTSLRLAGTSTAVIVIAGVVGAAVFLVAVPEAAPSSGVHVARIVLLAVLLSVLALGAFMLGLKLAGFDPDASSIADRLAIDETSRELFDRWMHRVRWRRWIGGAGGVVVALFSGQPGWLLFLGLAGAALGSLSAELHLCRPSPRQGRVVSLERRVLSDYIDQRTVLGLLAVLAVALGVVGWTSLGASSRAGLGWAVTAVVVLLIVPVFAGLVVHRRRPALSPELNRADDLLRRLAVSNGIAQPVMCLSLICATTALLRAGADVWSVVVGCAALVVWWRNRRGGLDYVLKHPVKAAHLLSGPTPASGGT